MESGYSTKPTLITSVSGNNFDKKYFYNRCYGISPKMMFKWAILPVVINIFSAIFSFNSK